MKELRELEFRKHNIIALAINFHMLQHRVPMTVFHKLEGDTTNELTSNQNSHYWFFIYLVCFYYTTKMILTCTFFTPLVNVHNSYFNVILLVLQRVLGITSVITSLSYNS